MQIIKPIFSSHSVHHPIHGLTGSIRLNNVTKIRSDAEFYVIEMGVNGTAVNTGIWKTNSANLQRMLSMTDKILPNTHESMLEETKTQRLLKVVSIEERPYVIKKTLPNGRVIYEGFCIDLLNRLSEDLNFEYKLTIVADGRYGDRINGTKEWDGMIGEILKGEADAAVAPITVTANRLEVVDFTDPFLQLGISMLMRIPEDHKASNSILSFFSPLSWNVWAFLILVTILSVFAVVTVTILSPTEDSKIFNGPNSIWYLICILLRAGSGYNCRSVASRLISTAWWTFSLILIAQYTANFAAVLTIDRKTLPFNYELTQHCNLTKVGNVVLGSNGYSIALPKESKWRDRISRQILDYNEKGVMLMIKKKWWKKTPQIEECEGKAVEIKRSLGMDKISGIFAMLGIGLLVAFIVATTERTFLEKIKRKPQVLNPKTQKMNVASC
uniref:Uncharacterized protein n=1 Tax=Panagrolaimus sp. JU765 TaxID=591449 RepID=A0AC34RF31_9BILA